MSCYENINGACSIMIVYARDISPEDKLFLPREEYFISTILSVSFGTNSSFVVDILCE
jgi:hypothetical protein